MSLLILQVDQDGAIADVATKRPIVYPQMGGRGMSRERCPTNEPQKGAFARPVAADYRPMLTGM